ncbi:hypothetical protein [Microtetraspora glauca]|uniref:Uncharacterized protein n=1 Tax=Microtetraspora glauca TaxID=1996 RepID=A0ABV3G9E3_MICGL
MAEEVIDPLAEVESLLSRHLFSPVTVVDWQRLEPWAELAGYTHALNDAVCLHAARRR